MRALDANSSCDDFLHATLTAGDPPLTTSEAELLEAHLHTCARCQREANELADLTTLMESAPGPSAEEVAEARMGWRRVREHEESEPSRRSRVPVRRLAAIPGIRSAAAVAAFLLSLVPPALCWQETRPAAPSARRAVEWFAELSPRDDSFGSGWSALGQWLGTAPNRSAQLLDLFRPPMSSEQS